MPDGKQLMTDLISDLEVSERTPAALRSLADLYERCGSTQIVAHELRLMVDGDVDPEKTRKFVEHVRREMYRLLLNVQIDWFESREARRINGH